MYEVLDSRYEMFLHLLPMSKIQDAFSYADDSMAILMAFQSPELEILGLTTIFGNVATDDATSNALLLVCNFLHSAPSLRW